MATASKFGFALAYVDDIEAATRFYVDVLGMEVERAAPVFVQFKDHFAIASDESMDGTGNLELYWIVDDADAAYKKLSATSEVAMSVSEKPFGKVFALNDPSGQPRYLVEFAKRRPSQPAR